MGLITSVVKSVSENVKSVSDKVNSFLVPKEDVEPLLEEVMALAVLKFKDDKSKPGILISKVSSTRYYVAVHRFLMSGGRDKVVEMSHNSHSLIESLTVVKELLEKV